MTHPAETLRTTRRSLLIGLPALTLSACVGGDSIVPDVALPGLPGLKTRTGWDVPGFRAGLFRNQVLLLNVWASWCGYCRGEHPHLKTVEEKLGVPLMGMVVQDSPLSAVKYLKEAGNPFRAVALDGDNVIARAVRQRGVPGTYVIGHDGLVVARHPGALTPQSIDRLLRPGIAEAQRRRAVG